MRYYDTDFTRSEQHIIDALRNSGRYVYSLIDDEEGRTLIRNRGFINRFGFLVTDEPIAVGEFGISYEQFEQDYSPEWDPDVAELTLEKKEEKMTCKEMRCRQLDELKDGIFPGTYAVTITRFDGRLVAKYAYDTKDECDRMYHTLCEEYKYRAHVKRSVCFEY